MKNKSVIILYVSAKALCVKSFYMAYKKFEIMNHLEV